MAIKYIVDNNDGNSPIQTISGDLYANAFYGDGSNLTGVTGGSFTGNTSANCITDIWVENLHGCSGTINVFTDLSVSDGLFANYVNANTFNGAFVGDGSQLNNLPPAIFTGNTSGDCISEIWVQNLNGCEGTINLNNNLYVNGIVTATTYSNLPIQNSINSGPSAPGTAVVANDTAVDINFSDGIGTAWSFSASGLTFPDDTVQTTAYTGGTGSAPTLYLLEATTDAITYTLPGGFVEDPCRYSIVSNTVNVPSNWFDITGYTFTPQKAGYWEIVASYDVYRATEASLGIEKNNFHVAVAGSFNAVAQIVTKIVYLNGSTDFISVFNAGGASQSRDQFAARSWFQARWVGE
jgi:hypothetical protein